MVTWNDDEPHGMVRGEGPATNFVPFEAHETDRVKRARRLLQDRSRLLQDVKIDAEIAALASEAQDEANEIHKLVQTKATTIAKAAR